MKVLEIPSEEERRRKSQSALKIQREMVPSLSARSGFYRLMIA